jgi:hypothetical protein
MLSASGSSLARSNASEPHVVFNGENGGAMDMPCPGRAESSDKCACQVRCRRGGCNNALRLCRRLGTCSIVSVNAPTLEAASWATLKRLRPPAESWLSRADADAILARGPPPDRQPPPHAGLAGVPEDHWSPGPDASTPLCGSLGTSGVRAALATARHLTLGLLALTFRQPRSLESSLRSWQSGGLLDIVSEKLLIANDPMVEELALAASFGFVVRQPNQLTGAKPRKPNVITIGQALYFGLRELASDHVLFLEKDFALVEGVTKPKLAAELTGAAALLHAHATVVYLRSRTEQGCDSFLPCGRPFVTRGGAWATRNNWWNFYCPGFRREGRVADCLARDSEVTRAGAAGLALRNTGRGRGAAGSTGGGGRGRQAAWNTGGGPEPGFRCYTSEDANWSLNTAMLNRTAVLSRPLCVGGGEAGCSSTTVGQLAEQSHARQVGRVVEGLSVNRRV